MHLYIYIGFLELFFFALKHWVSGSSGRSNVQPVNRVMEDLWFLGGKKPLGTGGVVVFFTSKNGVFFFLGGGLDFDRWEDLFLYLYPFDIISIDLESCSRLRIFFYVSDDQLLPNDFPPHLPRSHASKIHHPYSPTVKHQWNMWKSWLEADEKCCKDLVCISFETTQSFFWFSESCMSCRIFQTPSQTFPD